VTVTNDICMAEDDPYDDEDTKDPYNYTITIDDINIVTEMNTSQMAIFDTKFALCPNSQCSEFVFEMNNALPLRLDQSGTLNQEYETIKNIFWTALIDFMHRSFFMNYSKSIKELAVQMPTLPLMENAISMFLL